MPQDKDPLANLTKKEIITILESLRPKALFELCSVYDPEPLPESIHTFLQEANAGQCQELLLRTLHRVYVVERQKGSEAITPSANLKRRRRSRNGLLIPFPTDPFSDPFPT